jgi:hypothetical protein
MMISLSSSLRAPCRDSFKNERGEEGDEGCDVVQLSISNEKTYTLASRYPLFGQENLNLIIEF